MAAASCPIGAMIITRSARSPLGIRIFHDLLIGAEEDRHPAQDALKLFEWQTDANASACLQLEFTNGFLVIAAALLHNCQRLLHFAGCLEIAQVKPCRSDS